MPRTKPWRTRGAFSERDVAGGAVRCAPRRITTLSTGHGAAAFSPGRHAPGANPVRKNPMKHLITILTVALAALSAPAFATSHKEAPLVAKPASAAAAASAPTMGAQQNKMGRCSDEFKATGRAGAERQAFMSECLKKDAPMKTTQQNKMSSCSTEFKTSNKPGSERQAFMKECLSK